MPNTRRIAATAALSAGLALAAPGLAAAGAHGVSASPRHHPAHHAHSRVTRRTFIARVVHSSKGSLVVRTRSGRLLTFSARQITAPHHHVRVGHATGVSAGGVILNIVGLAPGELVQITESTDASGTTTITLTLPPAAVTAAAQTVSGTAENVGSDTFDLITADGSDFRMHEDAATLAASTLAECSTVSVTFHQDANLLVVDSLTVTGTDASCAAASGGSDGGDGSESDVVGVITSVGASSVTLGTPQGPTTVSVDPSSGLSDGFNAGDLVDVTFHTDANGTAVADDIEYAQEDLVGTMTAIDTSSGTPTLTISGPKGPVSFTPDYANGADDSVFDGIAVGDVVDVSYSVIGGQLLADDVSPQ